MLLVFIFAILNQIVLVIIFSASAAIVAIISLPKVTKMVEQQGVEYARKIDLSDPLRRREFLSIYMWLKLAYRWGIRKTMLIFSLFTITIIAVILTFILSMWGIMDIWNVMVLTISSTIGTVTLFYRQISKALKEIQLSKPQTLYDSSR